MSCEDRSELERRLASLFGSEGIQDSDSLSETLEHILTIGSVEDVRDYMSQLLGIEGDKFDSFAENILRFRKGEHILPSSPSNENLLDQLGTSHSTSKPASDHKMHHQQKKQHQRQPKDQVKKVGSNSNTRGNKKGASSKNASARSRGTTSPKQEKTSSVASRATASSPVQGKAENIISRAAPTFTKSETNSSVPKNVGITNQNRPISDVVALAPLQRGEAKVVCGCFGFVHKPLTNCLHCGRVSCRKEGYGYCPYCGYMIQKVVVDVGNSQFDKALLHKQRLLKYDRELTQRTVVLDDQADYFQSGSSSWLTESEREEASRRDDARRDEVHGRKMFTLGDALQKH